MIDKKLFQLRWYYAHQGIMVVLFVLRIIELLGFFGQISNIKSLVNYGIYELHNSFLFTLWYIAIIIIASIRIIYNGLLIKGLKNPTSETYSRLIVYFSLTVILSFMYGIAYSIWVGIIGALLTALLISPIYIYYRKRRSFFCEQHWCKICKKPIPFTDIYLIEDDEGNTCFCCSACYEIINMEHIDPYKSE